LKLKNKDDTITDLRQKVSKMEIERNEVNVKIKGEVDREKNSLVNTIDQLRQTVEEKEKLITEIRAQQVEAKRVELITLQKNLEEKFRIEKDTLIDEQKRKVDDLKKKK